MKVNILALLNTIFNAGYDLSVSGGVKSMLEEFDKMVGLQYLRAFHLNDSKGELHLLSMGSISGPQLKHCYKYLQYI